MTDELTHVRVTQSIFPSTFIIPLSASMTITQMHVPVDDTHTYWYAFFTSFDKPLDGAAMRAQRAPYISLPDYIPVSGRHNQWGFNPDEQRDQTYLGMGEDDINVHDQWAVESMGAVQNRTREHLGTSDKLIVANRRQLQQAIDSVESGGPAPGVSQADVAQLRTGPDTVDGVAPAGTCGVEVAGGLTKCSTFPATRFFMMVVALLMIIIIIRMTMDMVMVMTMCMTMVMLTMMVMMVVW
jgi:hypothetical protein